MAGPKRQGLHDAKPSSLSPSPVALAPRAMPLSLPLHLLLLLLLSDPGELPPRAGIVLMSP